jgi:hypothetical protein
MRLRQTLRHSSVGVWERDLVTDRDVALRAEQGTLLAGFR